MAFDISSDSTTSVSTDLAELSEGETPETLGKVEAPPKEDEPGESEPVEPEITNEEEEVKEPEKEVEEEIEDVEAKITDLHPSERPSLKIMEESFPGLLKKFPSLRDVYAINDSYTKMFPTIDDAKEANENNEAFNSIRESVFNDDGSKFFSAIKEVSDKSLEKFATTILPTLYKVHPVAFWRTANPLVEDICKNMFSKGEKEKNESLQNAARYLSDYFFGSIEIAEGKKTSIIKIEEEKPSQREQEFEAKQETSFRTSVETDIRKDLVSLIEGKDPKTEKSRIDPDSVFSPFIKSIIVDKVIDDLGKQLAADKDHIKFMDSLWGKAKRNGRSDSDKSRLISAYMARAKSLIPTLRSKYVSEALGQSSRRSAKAKEKTEEIESRKEAGTLGRSSNSNNKNYSPKSINYNKTSDMDILNDNINYK